MKNIKIKTQLGGKFSSKEPGLFLLKKKLELAGIKVEYPKSNKIVKTVSGVELTFDPQKTRKSFLDVEIDFDRAIKENDVHIIHNKFIDQIGYVGESAGIELSYALLHNKPIILLYKPVFSDSLPKNLVKIINANLKSISITRLDKTPTKDVKAKVLKVINMKHNYKISILEEITIYQEIDKLLNNYKNFK